MNLNTKRFLAAVLGICAGTAALLGVGDASAASSFSRHHTYLLASDGDKSTTATFDAAATSSKGRVLKTMEGPSRPMRILKVEEGTASDEHRELICLKPTTVLMPWDTYVRIHTYGTYGDQTTDSVPSPDR